MVRPHCALRLARLLLMALSMCEVSEGFALTRSPDLLTSGLDKICGRQKPPLTMSSFEQHEHGEMMQEEKAVTQKDKMFMQSGANMNHITWDDDPYIFMFKDESPGKIKMHMKSLDLHNWVRIDKTYKGQMLARKKLYQTSMDDIFVSRTNSPKTEECKREFFRLLVDHLLQRFPEIFEKQTDGTILNRVTGEAVSTDMDSIDEEDLLLRAGRLTQEDWIIMECDPEQQNMYVLTAGVLCFPSSWSLAEKFNSPMQSIHGPVKVYLDHMKDKVDSLFLRMKPDKSLWRANWGFYTSLDDTYDLFTHPRRKLHSFEGTSLPFEGEETGRKLFLRCEYQTLRKLPNTGCIVFGIRTYMRYLEDMKQRPTDEVQSLIHSIKNLDSEYLSYKGGDIWKDAALKYLNSILP